MSDRVILAVKFTPAGSCSQVRRAVGGFLRYVQHRDVHPTQPDGRPRPEVSGLLKYVAYRDRASTRADLFGPSGTLTSDDRKTFASFVANALEKSSPQTFRAGNGELRDRRRAVYRFVISPEHANGLDLRRLTNAAVGRLEQESGVTGLRWIAAIHRNTAHYHVHLVLAGMRVDVAGGYRRVDITKPRLAAMKEALGLEIERQRADLTPLRQPLVAVPTAKSAPSEGSSRDAAPSGAALTEEVLVAPLSVGRRQRFRSAAHIRSVITLRVVARRYQRQMERELEDGYSRSHWERVA
jgi:hypothetical protein